MMGNISNSASAKELNPGHLWVSARTLLQKIIDMDGVVNFFV